MATVHLKYFAQLRESRNRRDETLEVRDGTTVGALYQRLFPREHQQGLPVSYAVNSTHVKAETILNDRDEVAFLPPVGGG